jgi:hypothetical protein
MMQEKENHGEEEKILKYLHGMISDINNVSREMCALRSPPFMRFHKELREKYEIKMYK